MKKILVVGMCLSLERTAALARASNCEIIVVTDKEEQKNLEQFTEPIPYRIKPVFHEPLVEYFDKPKKSKYSSGNQKYSKTKFF